MKTIVIRRAFQSRKASLGILKVLGLDHDPVFTLENPWKQNQKMVSCIPEGSYLCRKYSSDKYPNVYQVLEVPNRTHILFHAGNFERDTKGCILLGLGACSLGDDPMVSNSRLAMAKFRGIMGDDEEFKLVIS